MSQASIVTLIIFVFAFVPLVLAEVARNKALNTVEDFFLYSRKMPTSMAFSTIFATWFSTFAALGVSASIFSDGPIYMTCFAWNILFAVCIYFISRRIWFYGKKHGYVTPTDFFSDIYGSEHLSRLVTLIMIVFTMPYLQIQLIGGTFLVDYATGGAIPWELAVLVFYVIMVVYLWVGGIRSVALTDMFYAVIIFVTMIVTGVYLYVKAGGTGEIFGYIYEYTPEKLTVAGTGGSANVLEWLTMFVVTPLGALMSPPMWIRSYSIGNKKAFSLLPLLLAAGTVCYVGSMLAGNAASKLGSDPDSGDMLIPELLIRYGSKVMVAVLFCGFCAAALSTANSQIHALSAIYSLDIHKRYINREAQDSTLIKITRWVLLFISVLTYIALLTRPYSIVDTGLLALSGTMQVLVPAMGALFWKRSNARGAYAGLLAGILVLLVLAFFSGLSYTTCGCLGMAVNTAVFIAVSLNTESVAATREKIITYRKDFEEDK